MTFSLAIDTSTSRTVVGIVRDGEVLFEKFHEGATDHARALSELVRAALGINDVTSPTFVISRIHKASLPLIHIDTYRLLDSGSAAAFLDDLDIDTAREGAVTVIEWGGAESARLSDERLEITIDRSDEVRDVQVKAIGARWQGFSL